MMIKYMGEGKIWRLITWLLYAWHQVMPEFTGKQGLYPRRHCQGQPGQVCKYVDPLVTQLLPCMKQGGKGEVLTNSAVKFFVNVIYSGCGIGPQRHPIDIFL